MVSPVEYNFLQSDAKGGKVLTFLHDYITQSITCENTKTLCIQLMEAACVPYMSMLSMWIFKGIISDPIKEVTHNFYDFVTYLFVALVPS